MWKQIFILSSLIFLSHCQNPSLQQEQPIRKNSKPDSLSIAVEFKLEDPSYSEERKIYVATPDAYHESKANYPVLYFTDVEQNLRHIVGTVELLTRTGSMPPLIVVGIESKDRTQDFTFSKSDEHPSSGGGTNFLAFIEEEVIPFVESNYRTHPYRILEGHSLGGLFTASVFLRAPKLFDAHIIMSPSFWWNQEEPAKEAEVFFNQQDEELRNALYFSIGTLESGAEYGMRKELKNFIDVIKPHRSNNFRFKHEELDGEGHMSTPLLSNYHGLKFIFADMVFPSELFENYKNETFLEHEDQIREKYGREAKQSAESYVKLAFHLLHNEKHQQAITVLKRSVEAYPFDVGLMNLLGNTYEKVQDKTNAIATYQKAITTSKKYTLKREQEFQAHIDRLNGN